MSKQSNQRYRKEIEKKDTNKANPETGVAGDMAKRQKQDKNSK